MKIFKYLNETNCQRKIKINKIIIIPKKVLQNHLAKELSY